MPGFSSPDVSRRWAAGETTAEMAIRSNSSV
jgi:hypothetical protein